VSSSLALYDCLISSQRGLECCIYLCMGKGHCEVSPTEKPAPKHKIILFSPKMRASVGSSEEKCRCPHFALGKLIYILLKHVF
jgi:hypothetical protein